MKYAMKKVRKNRLSGATAIVTPLIFLLSLATRRFWMMAFYYLFRTDKKEAHKCVLRFSGDPYGNRTHVTAVKGPCLNRLTNGP